jgi:DNA-binding response OmpR family regulator
LNTRTAADVHRIFVIYGDPESRLLLNQILAAAYDVVAIPYFPTVIAETFSRIDPDVVVVDIGLASGAVRDLCRQIRQASETVALFVLGSAEPAERILIFELGADDYIQKPMDTMEFLARVRARVR